MDPAAFRDRIINKAREFGADDAGVCLAADLLKGPTHSRYPLPDGIEDHHAILVFALSHPADQLFLDYYVKREGFRFGNSEGNRRLMEISRRIGKWFRSEGVVSRDLHYYVEMGGVFLKGAAILAGLGTIGRNNLFIHPGYGARIRFRAHLMEMSVEPSEPLDFDPCTDCDGPCLKACPASALDDKGYYHHECQLYMDREAAEAPVIPSDDDGRTRREVRSCRICEFACSYQGTLEKKDSFQPTTEN